ncbi:hypothetical protein BHM03_00054358 [Ensete ventricosum]|nr:hypothetical protein BHM03_00054358 [Ensete ventricosum]
MVVLFRANTTTFVRRGAITIIEQREESFILARGLLDQWRSRRYEEGKDNDDHDVGTDVGRDPDLRTLAVLLSRLFGAKREKGAGDRGAAEASVMGTIVTHER